MNDAVARSLRQGVFLSIIALVGLYLSAHSYLTIWTTLLLVVFMSLVEFFSCSKEGLTVAKFFLMHRVSGNGGGNGLK